MNIKTLITAQDIENYAKAQRQEVTVGADVIVTPAARDAAQSYKISLVEAIGTKGKTLERQQTTGGKQAETAAGVNQDELAQVIGKVLLEMGFSGNHLAAQPLEKLQHASGIRLVKGRSVSYEGLNGEPPAKAGVREIFTRQESRKLAVGFITLDRTCYSHKPYGDEVIYVISGTVLLTAADCEWAAQAGDVLLLPAGQQVLLSSRAPAVYLYVWQE